MSCKHCCSDYGENFNIKPCANGDMYIAAQIFNTPHDKPGVVIFQAGTAMGNFDINFCFECGKPLTEPKPLTLDELKELADKSNSDNAHIWIWFQSFYKHEDVFHDPSGYMTVLRCSDCRDGKMFHFGTSLHGATMSGHEKEYGKTWLAFDREPERKKDE